jgi:hypothetical protein
MTISHPNISDVIIGGLSLKVENHEKFFVIKNVLTKEESALYAQKTYEGSVSDPDYYQMRFFNIKKSLINLFGKNIDSEDITISTDPHEDKTRLFEIIKSCSLFIKENFELESTLEFKRSFIHIMEPGSIISAHNDDNDAFKGDGEQKHYSAVLIFNDNFEGGEFLFHNLGISMKPEPGTLIIFRGDEERLHGVDTVTSGYRVSMPIFFRTLKLFEK